MAARKRQVPRRSGKVRERVSVPPDAPRVETSEELPEPERPEAGDADRSAEEIAERDHPLG